jgi:hypothetical protein
LLNYDSNDLAFRIKKYFPDTKVELETRKSSGLTTPDSCFEVPYLSDSPEALAARELKE